MGGLTKAMTLILCGAMITLPLIASHRGWGIPGQKNATIMQQAQQICPQGYRDSMGRCRRTHRSYFGTRNYRGGGHRYGK